MRAEKAKKRLLGKREVAAIREEVMERAARSGGCEICGGPGVLQMHHLESGSGRRLQMQAVSNCIGICGFCHREYHRDPKWFTVDITEWCGAYGYPLPARFKGAA